MIKYNIMRFILKLKSGYIFLLLFILPIVLIITFNNIFYFEKYWAELILGIYLGTYYCIFIWWILSIISYFDSKFKILSPSENKRYRISIIGAVIYGLYLVLPISFKLAGNIWMFICTPIAFILGTFSLIYLFYCASKIMQTLQLGDKITKGDIVIHILLFFALPISIWWFQKRVNKYYKESK
jgi:hypothetical protein